MKTLAELAEIRDKMQKNVILREGHGTIRVIVGMGTCGIAAGARPVLAAFVEGIDKADLTGKVTVSQNGHGEATGKEPIVEVAENGKDTVTYINMTPEKVARVIEEHLKGGKIVGEFTK